MVIIAYREIINNPERMRQQQEVNPNLDIALSLKKGIINFWGTHTGWKNKKKVRSIEINMVSTLINSIDKNRVYLPKEQYGNQRFNAGQRNTRPGYDATGNALGAVAKPGEYDEGIITLEGVPDHR